MKTASESKKRSAENAATTRGIQLIRFQAPFEAFGRAVNLLDGVAPYATYAFGVFARALAGQIERGHYVFAVKDNKLVGYLGWAMCTKEIAEAWVAGRRVPTFQECKEGDHFVLMTAHATSEGILRQMTRACRALYPKHKAIFSRDYQNGRPRRVGSVYNRSRAHPSGA